MRLNRSRLARLEATIAAERQANLGNTHMLYGTIARAQLAAQPGLAEVTEADTDPATYSEILEMRAWARNDHERAEELRQQNRRGYAPSPNGPFRSMTDAQAAFAKWMNEVMLREIRSEVAAQVQASDNALRRLASARSV